MTSDTGLLKFETGKIIQENESILWELFYVQIRIEFFAWAFGQAKILSSDWSIQLHRIAIRLSMIQWHTFFAKFVDHMDQVLWEMFG